ncbi:MAG: hypothetical protein GY748_07380 [Planctomycetaceae bacterium]|nr:hypothetical protein [Planctomycetaceae bacterium]
MSKSPLFGRRIHISGSISGDVAIASTEDVDKTRKLVAKLVEKLIKAGATFVVPVDAEKLRGEDGSPICFDWLVWKAIKDNIAKRPSGAPNPLAIAVQHHKSEDQIPTEMHNLWDELRETDLVEIENASHWNMNSKRMELQAKWGDVLIAIGGSEGVTYLANLYHDAGKPVVPLNAALTPQDAGARKLFAIGLTSNRADQLFRSTGKNAHHWVNQINFSKRSSVDDRAATLIELLEDLEPPKAFAVRLLNPDHDEFGAVEDFFETIVKPVLEDEMGYQLVVIDGEQEFEYSRIDQEIFSKLHRSKLVIADITGTRPNCFLELGYALGRSTPTIVTSREGSDRPFDIATLAGFSWKMTGTSKDKKQAFSDHLKAVRNRPPLVPMEPLIS